MQSPLDVTFHPLDLGEYGRTPGGLLLYRIVWADSRLSKLSYEGKIHELPRYAEQPTAEGKWILEKWLSAEKYHGMTREQWEAFMASMPFAPQEGYSADGEYELVHIYPGTIEPAEAREFVARIEHRLRNVSLADRKKEVIAEQDAKVEAAREAKFQLLDEIAGRDAPKEEVNTAYAIG